MFTGIIEEVGTVERMERLAGGARLDVSCTRVTGDLEEGASVCVNGVCLTAVRIRPGGFSADVSSETVNRSNLAALRDGSQVNLERALSPSGRLGGHIVQGHVDGTGVFLSLSPAGGEDWWLKIRVPEELRRYVVSKGSIAIDGISLTVAALDGDVLSAAVIPHTYRSTNLPGRRPGDVVNLEADILAKYVERLLRAFTGREEKLTIEKLREMGY